MTRKAIFLSGHGSYDPDDIFFVKDLDEVGSTTYVGKSKKDSSWQITKMVDTSGDLALSYASIVNNSSRTTYALAWTNRVTLTYSDISET